MMNNNEVRCLQQFLKLQGSEIYPESTINGNFSEATKSAVIRFQEKYAAEILAPFGLEKGTGFVGQRTRAKINQLLGR
jgi:peptidoglycan hydrolase-like protein with peptidoglycan-binding domain